MVVPKDQDPATQHHAIDEAFLSGFRAVMAIGAALAVGNAVTALLLIRTVRST